MSNREFLALADAAPVWSGDPAIDTASDGAARPCERESAFFPASMLAAEPVPDRPWLVRDWIPSRTVTLFSGDGGTGKSLIALQLATAVATGQRWLGMTPQSGPVMYLSAEDDRDEIHRRLHNITGGNLSDLSNLHVRSLAGEDALLATLDRSGGALLPTDLCGEIDQYMDDLKPALCVLDTLADLFPGNENDRSQARQFIGLLRGLGIRHSTAVVVLAHPSLTGLASGSGSSGSTGWSNSVRSRLYLSRITEDGYEQNPDARLLTIKKTNYARTGNEIKLTWRDGKFTADAPESNLDRAASSMRAERVFLKLLSIFQEQGRHVSASPSSSYAPSRFAKHPDAEGVTKHAFASAMENLLRSGRISIAEHGTGAKTRTHLVIVRDNQ